MTPNRRGHMASHIERRKFLATLGGVAVAWPLAARAQQGTPVIGFLDPTSPEVSGAVVSDLQLGLRDAGYIDGQNVAIEVRWGNAQPVMGRLASDLVRLKVAVIFASGAVHS